MPDDEKADIIEIRKVLDGVQSKISELEKKIQNNAIADLNHYETSEKRIDNLEMKYDIGHGQRIEKLECKVAENREYSIQLKELYDKELSELKKRVEGIYRNIHGIENDGDSELVIRTVEEEWERDQAIAKHWQQRIRNLKNGGEKSVLKSGDKDSDLPKSVKLTDTDSKPQFICNKCGGKIYLPGVGELKGKYMCANCNNWQEKEKPPKTWADYGFKKDHQEVTDITEKPPEQDAGSARQTDDEIYSYRTLYKGGYFKDHDPDKYILVEKADLEWLLVPAHRKEKGYYTKLLGLQKKYPKEEAEK